MHTALLAYVSELVGRLWHCLYRLA